MKNKYLLWGIFIVTTITFGQTNFIDEIHYDTTIVEIAGPTGTDLAGYEVRLYNGSDSEIYGNIVHLSGIIPNQQNGNGTIWFNTVLQNGSPDGLALINPLGEVIEFLSYEGVITAADGPAIGLTSTNIGVLEDSTTSIGYSLQLTDNGWAMPMNATPNLPNTNQTTLSVVKNEIAGFSLYPNPISNGKLFIKSNNGFHQQVEIYSMVGQNVYKKNVQPYEAINISNLTSGIYMVKVIEGARIATRKLIIK